MGLEVLTRFPFKYAGTDLDRGELIELRGTRRDEQLLGLRYFVKYDPTKFSKKKCERDGCGRLFAGEQYLFEHQRKKGGCMSVEQKTTKLDTAQLLNVDVENLRMPDETPVHVDETSEFI